MYIIPAALIDSKNIFRMFSRIRLDRRITLMSPVKAWFSAYSALYYEKQVFPSIHNVIHVGNHEYWRQILRRSDVGLATELRDILYNQGISRQQVQFYLIPG